MHNTFVVHNIFLVSYTRTFNVVSTLNIPQVTNLYKKNFPTLHACAWREQYSDPRRCMIRFTYELSCYNVTCCTVLNHRNRVNGAEIRLRVLFSRWGTMPSKIHVYESIEVEGGEWRKGSERRDREREEAAGTDKWSKRRPRGALKIELPPGQRTGRYLIDLIRP